MLDVLKLVEESHRIARSKGWWRGEEPMHSVSTCPNWYDGCNCDLDHNKVLLKVEEKLVLISGELVGEAFEEYRRLESGRLSHILYECHSIGGETAVAGRHDATEGDKPCEGDKPAGFLIELADAMVRIADLSGAVGIGEAAAAEYQARHEVHAEIQSLPPSVAHQFRVIERLLSTAWPVSPAEDDAPVVYDELANSLGTALAEIEYLATLVGASIEDFARAIEIKQVYNKSRPYRHGNLNA